jgi:hypothetical protein
MIGMPLSSEGDLTEHEREMAYGRTQTRRQSCSEFLVEGTQQTSAEFESPSVEHEPAPVRDRIRTGAGTQKSGQ